MSSRDVQTIRQPSFTSLFVDSMDRYANGFPYDTSQLSSSSQWTLQSRQYVLNGYFNRIALTQIQFFWNLPTIITDYNNSIAIGSADGTSLLGYITIPQGWYTCDSLALDLSTLFDAIITGGTVSADPHSGAFTFTAPTQFSILPPNFPNLTGGINLYGRTYQTTGIIPGIAPAVGGDFALTGIIPTMLPTRYIDVGSRYLTKFQKCKDQSTLISGQITNILARVYAFAPFTRTHFPPSTNSGQELDTPVVLCIDYGTGKQLDWGDDEVISNFDITLTDEYGGIVPWTPQIGCEYAFTLSASET
jgi:hypothetical protein